MATESKYITLANNILLEYVYDEENLKQEDYHIINNLNIDVYEPVIARLKLQEPLIIAGKDAEKMISDAKKKSDKLEKSAKESIKIAFRDSVLDLQNSIQNSFIKELGKMVKKDMSDKKTIKEMILKIIETSSGKSETEILIADPIRDEDTIKAAVYGITQEMLKDGMELKHFASKDRKGIIIRESKNGLEIDLTDKVVSELLLEHLLPIYQNLLKGEK
jgi:V/A-type H+-transporting ATPase subunit E